MTCHLLGMFDVKFQSDRSKPTGMCLFCSLLEVMLNSLVSSFVDISCPVSVVKLIITF